MTQCKRNNHPPIKQRDNVIYHQTEYQDEDENQNFKPILEMKKTMSQKNKFSSLSNIILVGTKLDYCYESKDPRIKKKRQVNF